MKKTLTTSLLAILMCVCMVFGFTACGGFTQNDIDNAVNEATAPLNEQITALEADIADKAAKIATLESEKTALTTEKTELQADIATLEAAKATLTAEKADLENDVAALEAEKKTLSDKNAELEASITAKNTEIETLNSSISDLNTEKTNLTARVTELEASITEKDNEITSLTSSIETLRAEKQALSERVSELEAENEALKNCLKGVHDWNEGACTVCEATHDHAESDWADGACTVCEATHDHAESDWADGACTVCGATAKITGVSITVDGTTYTKGETATITPSTQSIIITVTGTDLQNGTLDNRIKYVPGSNRPLISSYGLTISEDGTSATLTIPAGNFAANTTAYEILYSNEGESNYIGSEVSVIYSVPEEDKAVIAGLSITVDGVEYTSGQTVTITPDTQSIIITVTGTNLQNGTYDNRISYESATGLPVTPNYNWNYSEDGTSATLTIPAGDFVANTTAFEILYSNGNKNYIGTGIYVIYVAD